jgi:hypothetical protein
MDAYYHCVSDKVTFNYGTLYSNELWYFFIVIQWFLYTFSIILIIREFFPP